MSGLEADRAVVDTCSPSRIYAWVCIILYAYLNSSEFPRLSSSFPGGHVGSQAPSFGMWRDVGMIWEAGRGNWELADHQGCIMSRYHVYKSFGNPDCLEYSRFIHQHVPFTKL